MTMERSMAMVSNANGEINDNGDINDNGEQ